MFTEEISKLGKAAEQGIIAPILHDLFAGLLGKLQEVGPTPQAAPAIAERTLQAVNDRIAAIEANVVTTLEGFAHRIDGANSDNAKLFGAHNALADRVSALESHVTAPPSTAANPTTQ